MKQIITPREREVEVIKHLLFRISKHYTMTEKIEQIVKLENHYYSLTMDKEYLLMAVDHIAAYLELGHDYKELQELFDTTLAKLNTDKKTTFNKNFYYSEEVRVNKAQLKRILGRWIPIRGGMKKDAAVEDIMNHLIKNEIGEYSYINKKGKFELIIKSDEIYAIHLTEYAEKFYTFALKQVDAIRYRENINK